MCEAGRVLHHLRHNISDSRNTVLLTGYQAENTLGRKLKEGITSVKIFGLPEQVKARVESLDELSGHADSGELLQWMKPMVPTLRRVFLVHGEAAQTVALAREIQSEYGLETVIAAPERQYDLVP